MSNKTTKTLVISVLFGLLSAFVGTFFAVSFLLPGGFFTKDIDIEGQTQEFLKTSLGIKAYGRLEVFEFLDKALPSVAGIYKKKASSSRLIDNIYLDKDRLGHGFVLTSDGWIITDASVISGWSPKGLAIIIDEKIYDASLKLYDSWTNVVFLKVEASDLRVASFGDSETLKMGDILFSGTGKNNFWFSYVNAINYYPKSTSKAHSILSSEEFNKFITLQDEPPADLMGGMVANRAGEIVGIISSNQNKTYILPINYFKNIISDILKDRQAKRPYLGVNYIDLDSVLASELPGERGAYVYGGGLLQSVVYGSPAYQAGIKTGDMILSIDNENITEYKNLAEIISEYHPGDEVVLKVLRGGEEIEIKVKLGSK